VFEVTLPDDIGREEHTEGNPANPRPGSLGLAYAVYAAPADTGSPNAAIRTKASAPGQPTTDAFSLIYRTEGGDVQVISRLAPDRRSDGGKPMPPSRPQTLTVAGVTWEVIGSTPQRFNAGADLGDAYVSIQAPNQAAFERVASALQHVDR
jgi:hypothetical protein